MCSGTSAQQLDASFNTTSALEIFEMDFADTSMDMKLRGSLSTAHRSGVTEELFVLVFVWFDSSVLAVWFVQFLKHHPDMIHLLITWR